MDVLLSWHADEMVETRQGALVLRGSVLSRDEPRLSVFLIPRV